MTRTNYSPEEIVRLGKRLYAEDVRSKVEPNYLGKFVVVDIESGDYEVGKDDIDAAQRMLSRRPTAVLYGVRVGQDVAYTLGGGQLARDACSRGE